MISANKLEFMNVNVRHKTGIESYRTETYSHFCSILLSDLKEIDMEDASILKVGMVEDFLSLDEIDLIDNDKVKKCTKDLYFSIKKKLNISGFVFKSKMKRARIRPEKHTGRVVVAITLKPFLKEGIFQKLFPDLCENKKERRILQNNNHKESANRHSRSIRA